MIEELLGEAPKDWQAEAAKIPPDELAKYLKQQGWLTVKPGAWLDLDDALDNAYRVTPVHLVSQNKYYMDYVEPGDLKIRLSGSLRDVDLEEAIRDAYEKHNWRLADKIADLI